MRLSPNYFTELHNTPRKADKVADVEEGSRLKDKSSLAYTINRPNLQGPAETFAWPVHDGKADCFGPSRPIRYSTSVIELHPRRSRRGTAKPPCQHIPSCTQAMDADTHVRWHAMTVQPSKGHRGSSLVKMTKVTSRCVVRPFKSSFIPSLVRDCIILISRQTIYYLHILSRQNRLRGLLVCQFTQ